MNDHRTHTKKRKHKLACEDRVVEVEETKLTSKLESMPKGLFGCDSSVQEWNYHNQTGPFLVTGI